MYGFAMSQSIETTVKKCNTKKCKLTKMFFIVVVLGSLNCNYIFLRQVRFNQTSVPLRHRHKCKHLSPFPNRSRLEWSATKLALSRAARDTCYTVHGCFWNDIKKLSEDILLGNFMIIIKVLDKTLAIMLIYCRV
jgi:hypothetical protein